MSEQTDCEDGDNCRSDAEAKEMLIVVVGGLLIIAAIILVGG